MKKINLKEISEILSEKELKNVMGGSGCKGATCFQCAGFSGIYRGVLPVTV
jgi:natural product precursor